MKTVWLGGGRWRRAAAWGMCAAMAFCQPVFGAQEAALMEETAVAGESAPMGETAVAGESAPMGETAVAGESAPTGETAVAGEAAPIGETAVAGEAAPAGEASSAGIRHPLIYLKNNDIYHYNEQTGQGEKVTGYEIGPGNSTINMGYYYSNPRIDEYLFANTSYSSDGRYLCHLDDLDTEKAVGTLYFQDVQAGGEQTVVDYNVSNYMLLKDSRLIYTKEDYLVLYLYDMERGEVRPYQNISEDLYIEEFSEDMTKAVCVDDRYLSADLLLLDLTIDGAGLTPVLQDIDDVEYVSKDLMSVYYEKDDILYCLRNLKDSVKVGENVKKAYPLSGGRAYYLTYGASMGLGDYLVDDMKEADAKMRVPYPTDYQKQVQQADGTAVSQVDMERYEAAMKEYEAKQARDELRELMDMTMTRRPGNLYYFDGSRSRLVKESVDMVKLLDPDSNVLGVSHEVSGEIHKIPLSQIEERIEEFEEMVLSGGYEYYLSVGGELHAIGTPGSDTDYLRYMNVDSGQKLVYYLDDWTGYYGSATLKCAPYGENGLGAAQTVDTGVDYICADTEGPVYYIKSDEEYREAIYTGGMMVCDDAYDYAWSDGVFYYYKNSNAGGSAADLYRCTSQGVELVAPQTAMFEPYADGSIAVLQDYVEETERGTLCLWRTETGSVKIDDEVKEIKEILDKL